MVVRLADLPRMTGPARNIRPPKSLVKKIISPAVCHNSNDEDFYIRAGGSLGEVLVSGRAVLDIQSPFFPGVDWHARRINPQPVAVGKHLVGSGKEGIKIYGTPSKRKFRFFARCLDQ